VILYQARGDLAALWDQESVVLFTYSYHESKSIFCLWNFRRGLEKSTLVKFENFPVRCLETLQFSSSHNGETKYVAAGLASGVVYLLRVPSFEDVQRCSQPGAKSVQSILQLLDGDSFMCGHSCGTLVRWYRDDSNKKEADEGFKKQLFKGNNLEVIDLQQMRHDPRKLISCCGSDLKGNLSIWDIESATRLYVLPDIKVRRAQSIFELESSGLFMSLASLRPKIWDLSRVEPVLLSVINAGGVVFSNGVQLRNGNLLLTYQQKGVTFFEEHQLIRSEITIHFTSQ